MLLLHDYSIYGPLYMLDLLQRRLMERLRRLPSMMMFYANRPDLLAFSWGIARLCGALYTNTPEEASSMDETPFRNFEKKYGEALFDCESMAQIGFPDSLENRRYGVACEASRMKFWIQSAIFENLPVELVDSTRPDTWRRFSALCVNKVHLLSDQEIKDLKTFAEEGGTLVVTGGSDNGTVWGKNFRCRKWRLAGVSTLGMTRRAVGALCWAKGVLHGQAGA